MIHTALQILLTLLFPWLSIRLSRWSRKSWLSPIVLCYGMGILLGNLDFFKLNKEVATTFSEVAVVLAIPLLLYATKLQRLRRYGWKSLWSFVLCVIAGLISTTAVAFWMHPEMPDSWMISGMLVGIYTGGVGNMQAIGLALQAEQEIIILLNAADIVVGAILLLFLSSAAHAVYGSFLPDFRAWEEEPEAATLEESLPTTFYWKDRLYALVLTLGIIGLALGLCRLFFGSLEHTAFILLLLTTLSIAASFAPRVNQWRGSFETGEYFLLVFGLAIGSLAEIGSILEQGGDIVGYTALALLGTLVLHLLLARLFRIDRDTVMITSTAALYGPVFVAQVATVIGNKKLVLAGIALGLLGYAIGNYLGLSLAYVLKNLLVAG